MVGNTGYAVLTCFTPERLKLLMESDAARELHKSVLQVTLSCLAASLVPLLQGTACAQTVAGVERRPLKVSSAAVKIEPRNAQLQRNLRCDQRLTGRRLSIREIPSSWPGSDNRSQLLQR